MKHLLAGSIGDRQRQVIHAVVDEYMTQRDGDVIRRLMPHVDRPAAFLIHEVVAGFGGLTQERVLGEKGTQINRSSSVTRFFEPGAYQEFHKFTEKDLLLLRKFGTLGDRGVTGMTDGELDHLTIMGNKLGLRIDNRMDKLSWDALFTGKYNYKGVDFDFDVPAANTIAAATDWSNSVNGTPFDDLELVINQSSILRKYDIAELVINKSVAADIRKSQSTNRFITNANVKRNDINEIAQFISPGLPQFEVVSDSFQAETEDFDGNITLGDAQFFVPNDKVLLVPNFSRTKFAQYGEFQVTENLNDPSATIKSPATGIYIFIDEKGLEERQSPFIKVVGGFNGAPNLMRPDDTLILTV